MITIPKEALFDLLHSSIAKFTEDYTDYEFMGGLENTYSDQDRGNDYSIPIKCTITKATVIDLLMNRVSVNNGYSIRVEA